MLSIPIKLDVSAEKAEQAIRKFYAGVENALDGIVDLNGTVINFDVNFRKTGDDVVKALSDVDAANKKVAKSAKKLDQGQENSLKRSKFRIKELKRERDELAIGSKAFRRKSAEIKRLESRLLSLQGVQRGSITALKAKRAELIQVKNNLKINSAEYKRLTAEIEKFDATLKGNNAQLDKTTKKTGTFFGVFAKIAVVSAGIQSIGAALRSVGNAIDVYTRRTKDVEGFNLALENLGMTQTEVDRVFGQAEKTAKSLGAPLQQVEKSYKRMLPALRNVGASAQESDKFIEAISARTQTLGLNTEQSGRLLEAFAQVLSKGKLQAEEMNQQISELDGAFRGQLAEALGVTTSELTEMMKNSEITAEVFVDAVNRMANGADILKQRVAEGNLTIQQLQNNIKTVDTKNIEAIGKAIEPAIRAFLKVRLAIAEFIEEFTKSPAFYNLKTVFNGIALGVEGFIKTILDSITAVNALLSPIIQLINFVLDLDMGFGGLVGILTQLALGYGVVTAAIYAKNKAIAMSIALQAKEAAAAKAGAGASLFKGAAAGALKLLPKLALVAGGLKLVSVAMKMGYERGREFDENLKDVGEKMQRIAGVAPTSASAIDRFVQGFAKFVGWDISFEVDQIANQIVVLKGRSEQMAATAKRLGVNFKDVDSINKLSKKTYDDLIDVEKRRLSGMQRSLETSKIRLKFLEDEGRGQGYVARELRKLIAELEKEIPLTEQNVEGLKESTHYREENAKATKKQSDKLQELQAATEKGLANDELAAIQAKTKAIRELASETDAAAQISAANIGIEQGVTEQKIARYEEEARRIKENANLNGEAAGAESGRIKELTRLIADERLKQAELGMQAQEAVNSALEDGIQKAQRLGDVSGNVASNLMGAFDGLAGSLTQGLNAATSLMDQLVADEIKGLEVGSRMRQEIVLKQLKGQAKANAIEHEISKRKLIVQNAIAQSEARIAQIRLRAEAEVARGRGQNKLAGALEKAADMQNLVVAGLKEQFRVGMTVLDLEKSKKDQALIRKGLDEKITNNQSKMGRILGVQKTTFKDSLKILDKMEGESIDLLDAFADSAESAQNMKEDANKVAIRDGANEARKIAKAFDLGADAAQRMKDELSDVKKLSEDISRIIGSGTGNPARAMGGPVQGGRSYFVNDGGGREGFLSNSGNFSMLPAARNINWTAPTSGVVIPANLVDRYQQALAANQSVTSRTSVQPASKGVDRVSASIDSGSLVQRMAAVMSGNGGDQRITNHVTIQSQEPVTDASKIMTNVARMKLRKGGRF